MKQKGASLVWRFQRYINAGHFSLVNDMASPVINTVVPPKIPKNILLFWHDKRPPQDVEDSIEKIKSFNADYNVQLFNSKMAREYIHDYYGALLTDLYERCCLHRAMQADFFRICYLLKEGGFYIDIDCYTSIDHICSYQNFACFLLFTRGNPSCIDNDFIVCEPNSFIIASILERIEIHLTMRQKFSNVWEYTGPGAVTMAIMSILLQEIADNGNTGMLRSYLKLGERSLTARAYYPKHFEYKNTREGNWKGYRLPADLHQYNLNKNV